MNNRTDKENNGWIKCSEKMPEKYERVLIVADDFQCFAKLKENWNGVIFWETEEFDLGFGDFERLNLEAVTHWHPELSMPEN